MNTQEWGISEGSIKELAGGHPADGRCHPAHSSLPALYSCSQNKDKKSALTAAGKEVGRVGKGCS